MHFTSAEPPPLPLPVQILWLWFFLAVPVGLPLLLWLWRSPRDARDVLRSATSFPVSGLRHWLEPLGWLLWGALLIPPLWVTVIVHSALFFSAESVVSSFSEHSGHMWRWAGPYADVPSGGWITAAAVVSSLCLALWLRRLCGSYSPPDVLRVSPPQ